jgi:hypothetical protein
VAFFGDAAKIIIVEVCTLSFAERVVLVCEDGPPEAEYALFDTGEIELRATSPGAIREVGYETTVERALGRLASSGITAELAAEAGRAMSTSLAALYARGPVVRRAAGVLGPAELFASRSYRARAYDGVWLDVGQLALDLAYPGAAMAMQLCGLVTALSELDPNVRVRLHTAPFTESRRPGERTYRRVDLSAVHALPERLHALAQRPPRIPERETGPSHVEILDNLRGRALAARPDAREHITNLERATSAPSDRAQPVQGPLSDPVMWSIESQISAGDLDGALGRISEVESQRGSLPPVQYLKSRASLLAGSEAPQVVAERVSLLVAKAPFAELELLAAQAWAAAGNMGRALPYARVLSMDPTADSFVRGQARAIVDAARQGVRQIALPSYPPTWSREPSTPPRGSSLGFQPANDDDLPPILDPRRVSSQRPGLQAERKTHGTIEVGDPDPDPRPAKRRTQPEPPALDLDLPQMSPGTGTRPPQSGRRGRDTGREKLRDSASGRPRTMMRGASRPAIDMRRLVEPISEVVEELSPPWEVGDAPGAAEARAQFTDMARELARTYRTERGIILKTDADGIEAMQGVLRSTRHEGIRTTGAMVDVRRHGAVVSEILARRLAARWIDVTAPELGHWTMDVRGIVHVRPFGRVLRFLEQPDGERDLVSFYLELWALVHGANVRP